MSIGSVYLLCDPATDCFKIGIARSCVSKRIKQLQTGNPCEIHMVKKYDTQIPFFIEKSLHRHFSSKHELNEWYNLDTEDIKNFESICKHYEEVADTLQDNPFFKYKKTQCSY